MELNYNRVELRGVAEDAPLLSHVNHGCAFYRFTLSVLRLSGQADKLPVIVPRPLLLLTPVSPRRRRTYHRPAAFLQQQKRPRQPFGHLHLRPDADP